MIEMSECPMQGFLFGLQRGFGDHLYSISDQKKLNALHNDVLKSCVNQDCQDEAIIEGLKNRGPPLVLAPAGRA